MSMRPMVLIAVLAVAVLGYVAWNQSTAKSKAASAPESQQEQPPAMPGSTPGMPPGMPGGTQAVTDQPSDPGVVWKTPSSWLTQIAGGMALATYVVPGKAKDQDAECKVYYFGPGKGGGVEPNLQRWIGEFSKLEKHDLTTRDVGGIKINRVEVSGTYASHGMTQGQDNAPHENWILLGAIAQGPAGDVFFKLTGPSATVKAAVHDFDDMMGSMKKK